MGVTAMGTGLFNSPLGWCYSHLMGDKTEAQ